ncbi:MAG: signal peptidase I [Bacillaceae bacterium]|nr:signal peptidase I [Bacillaceae bacterium]
MTSSKGEWLDWLKAMIMAFIFAVLIRAIVLTPIVVEGPSMLPNLMDGDQLLVNKLSYKLGKPERFDIIVFHATKDRDYIKRVIGLPGEHIAYQNNVLYVNGEPVQEPFDREITYNFALEDISGFYQKIPDRHVLVLGDNRTNSTDSRMIGLVSYDQIVGEAKLIYWPFNRFRYIQY